MNLIITDGLSSDYVAFLIADSRYIWYQLFLIENDCVVFMTGDDWIEGLIHRIRIEN